MQLVSLVEIDVDPLVIAPGDTLTFESRGDGVAVEAELSSDPAKGLTGSIGVDYGRTLGFRRPSSYYEWSSGNFTWRPLGQLQQPADAFPLVRKVRVKG